MSWTDTPGTWQRCPYIAGGRSSEGRMGTLKWVGTLIMCPYSAGGLSRWGSPKAGTTVYINYRTGSVRRGRYRDKGIGIYRENAIAIESESRYYARIEQSVRACGHLRLRNVICIVRYTSSLAVNKRTLRIWVSRLVLDHAIAAIQMSR